MAFKIKIDIEMCKGCGLCVHVCGQRTLKMSDEVNSSGSRYAMVDQEEKCTGCMHCAIICPDAAIEIEKYEDG
jgi:2-oxoglutarate ferredoxin oxidoreductase subunit delta